MSKSYTFASTCWKARSCSSCLLCRFWLSSWLPVWLKWFCSAIVILLPSTTLTFLCFSPSRFKCVSFMSWLHQISFSSPPRSLKVPTARQGVSEQRGIRPRWLNQWFCWRHCSLIRVGLLDALVEGAVKMKAVMTLLTDWTLECFSDIASPSHVFLW